MYSFAENKEQYNKIKEELKAYEKKIYSGIAMYSFTANAFD